MRRREFAGAALMALGAGMGEPQPASAAGRPRSPAPLFSAAGDFPLGPATSRTDYEAFDPASGRLYISKMGSGVLLVFDVRQNRLVAALPGFPRITGVLAVPAIGRLYASVPGARLGSGPRMFGGGGALSVLDLADLHELARVPAGVFPDGICYAPAQRRVFVSDELGGAVLAFDAASNRPLARIATGGQVGNVRYDEATRQVYAPIQTRGELAVIDPVGLELLRRDALPGGRHPHGFLVAPDGATGYAACDEDDRLLTVDLRRGRVLGVAELGRGPDVLTIDAGLKRLYVASESGVLSAFDIANPRLPEPLGNVFVGRGAHALAIDPGTHRLFFALADVRGKCVLRVLRPAR